MKIVKTFQPKMIIFTAMKNRCMLHGRVFVMTIKADWFGSYIVGKHRQVFSYQTWTIIRINNANITVLESHFYIVILVFASFKSYYSAEINLLVLVTDAANVYSHSMF